MASLDTLFLCSAGQSKPGFVLSLFLNFLPKPRLLFLLLIKKSVLRFRYCWWHCKHFIFISGIVCIKSMFRAVTCDIFYFTFWKSKRFKLSNACFSCRVGVFFVRLCTILLMATFFHSAQHFVYCVEPHGLIFIPNIS